MKITKYGKTSRVNGLGDRILWTYANLAMLFASMNLNKRKYDRQSFMIRARMFKGLRTGTMQVQSMFIDQHFKITTGDICAYCGEKSDNMALDHILPKSKGGKDSGDNLIKACRKCNSSKRDRDMLEWSTDNNIYINPWLLRNYLKLVYEYAQENNLLDKHHEELDCDKLPFNPDFLPLSLEHPEYYYDVEE
ncbi:MAG: HNH endonuclease [Rikenellaceae bacterium]